MEAFIIVLVAIIGFSFIFEMIFAEPELDKVIYGFSTVNSKFCRLIYRNRDYWCYGNATQFVFTFFFGANPQIRQNSSRN